MSRTNKLFMAIAKGKASSDATDFKRYWGVAPVHIVAVNPNKEELEKLYGNTIDNEPSYIGEAEVGDNKNKVPQIRLDFIVRVDKDKVVDKEGNPIDLMTRISFFVRKAFRTNRDNTKVQVIDKYGRTAWVTKEEFTNKSLPSYIDNPAKFDSNYRAAYWGEKELVDFIKAFLCIGNPEKWVDKKIVGLVDNVEDCEILFETIDKWFSGDISEIKDAVNLQPNNRVRVLFGIRTTDDNKQYQAVLTSKFIPMTAKKDNAYASLIKEVKERKENGAYPNTEFKVCDLEEYVNAPTNLDSKEDDMPDFSMDNSNPWA